MHFVTRDIARQRRPDAIEKGITGGQDDDRRAPPCQDCLDGLFEGTLPGKTLARNQGIGKFMMARAAEDGRSSSNQVLCLLAEPVWTIFADADKSEPARAGGGTIRHGEDPYPDPRGHQ